MKSNKKRTRKRVPDGHGQSFGSWPWQKSKWKTVQDMVFLGDVLKEKILAQKNVNLKETQKPKTETKSQGVIVWVLQEELC